MLVLTQKFGESIRIGGTTVTVVRVAGGKVRLGIEAPSEVTVSRAELAMSPRIPPPRPGCRG